MQQVVFNDICKKYNGAEHNSVNNFNLEIKKGEFIVFVGPSGCGKSTTLRMIAGLEDISSGEVYIDGTLVNDVHPKDRDIAMVFQNYALYPHMSVFDNIAFGLQIKKTPKEEIKAKVDWASSILGLDEYLDRKPKDLSGGQRQRVALGRAIVRNPKVFLMDEPLSNLDAKLRVHMRNEITKLHRDLGATTIYVTHDQIEAMTMASRIVVMKDGIVQQIGTPMDVYANPVNVFVASFIGAPQMNFLDVIIKDDKLTFKNGCEVKIPEGILKKINNFQGEVVLGIRPEHVSTEKINIDNFKDQIVTAKINGLELMGSETHLFVSIDEAQFIIKTGIINNKQVGDDIEFMIDINKAHFFNKETTKNLVQ